MIIDADYKSGWKRGYVKMLKKCLETPCASRDFIISSTHAISDRY